MTKAELIDCVYDKVGGFSKKESAEVVEAVFETMKDTLAAADPEQGKVKISGFGNFVVREKKQRIGRNPQTGEPIPISARCVLTFKPSQVLKNILNPQKLSIRQADPLNADPLNADPLNADPLNADPLNADPLNTDQGNTRADRDP